MIHTPERETLIHVTDDRLKTGSAQKVVWSSVTVKNIESLNGVRITEVQGMSVGNELGKNREHSECILSVPTG